MAYNMRAIAIVVLLAALAYLLYLWSKRRDQIKCPSCGTRVNMYAEECPSCGHEKGEAVSEESEPAGTQGGEEEDDLGPAEEDIEDTVPSEEEVSETLGGEAEDDEEYDKEEVDEPAEDEEDEDADVDKAEDVVSHACEECGAEFDSERGLNVHRGMKH